MTWDERRLSPLLARASREQGRLLGKMEGLGFRLRSEAHLRTLTEDVVKSSEIEGEKLDSAQVRSSIARKLGLDVGGLVPSDRNVDGVVELMVDATGKHAASLTQERLFGWHAALFPTGRNSLTRITVGGWRDDKAGPMQVVSGPVGRQKVHYQAPPANRLSREMKAFLKCLAKPGDSDGLLVAGRAHLWFATTHPSDAATGRIARATAAMPLARADATGHRFYSMSAQIRRERNAYYEMLEQTQNGGLDVTAWQEWFLGCLLRAIEGTRDTLGFVLNKAKFWERFAREPLNERQIKALNRLLDGFEGKLTTSRYAKLAKCSQDTAYRDILDLVERGALRKDPGGGRSTGYSLPIDS
jgi:Fic family protein